MPSTLVVSVPVSNHMCACMVLYTTTNNIQHLPASLATAATTHAHKYTMYEHITAILYGAARVFVYVCDDT